MTLLSKVVNNPEEHIKWKSYTKASNICVPNKDNYDKSDGESESVTNSEEWQDPCYNAKYELHKIKQKLSTTEQVVQDFIECVISLARKFLTQVSYKENKDIGKADQETLLKILRGDKINTACQQVHENK